MPVDRAQPSTDPMRLTFPSPAQEAGKKPPPKRKKKPPKEYESILVRFEDGQGYRDLCDKAAYRVGKSRNEWARDILLEAARSGVAPGAVAPEPAAPDDTAPTSTPGAVAPTPDATAPTPTPGIFVSPPFPQVVNLTGNFAQSLINRGVVDIQQDLERTKHRVFFRNGITVEILDMEIAESSSEAEVVEIICNRHDRIYNEKMRLEQDIPDLGKTS